MRRIDDNTFEIRTYDNGVLHFVIGSEYKAIGTCGILKDNQIKGILKFDSSLNELILIHWRYGKCSINERTLSYL